MSENFDLWGDPIAEPGETRGRPKHLKTDEKRHRVAVLVALNQSQADIAAAIGIREPTLRKHYFRELRDGLSQKRAEALVMIYESAKKGNVAAQKELIKLLDKADIDATVRRFQTADAKATPKKPPRLGKKEQADLDAATPDLATPLGKLMAMRADQAEKLQ